ncbi:globin domain-containing protein [Kitasatospora sp. NPDC047058]|uniref:globin domain-containing protein n=1 Tax=Kitasatospora sp. NPDC047058 TaxID=3155620 RepID=UPI0033DDC6D1
MPDIAPDLTPDTAPATAPDTVPQIASGVRPAVVPAALPAAAAQATGPRAAAAQAAPGGTAVTAVLPPMPLDPPDLPPMPLDPPDLPPLPAIPAPPSEPPAVPAPSRPPGAGPAGPPAPVVEPLFSRAPGLNWAGPGDAPEPAAGRTATSRGRALQTPGDPGPASAVAPAPLLHTAADQPPTARDIELIRASLAVVEPVADRATAHFYALIFLHHPEVRALFPAAMDVQRDRLFRALLTAARSADDPEGLRTYLSALGRGHRRYGTVTGHYGPVGECLVQALARYAGNRWDADTELAWRRVYRLVSSIMIEAAEEAARTSPPWWQAEVVGHERRTPDVAVITVRPDQAYPYRAGQYTSLETPWWPRVWRHFSFATAPRPDGLLTFHVKAVPAGWVSNALVHRAVPGNVLRLGPAAGAMTVDHARGADLLCLGGGTGIAPVRALVEEVAEYGAAGRSVKVFYGARQAAELYELEALSALAARHPWLSVHPVLSGAGASGGGALAGELPEVVGRFGPWTGRDAYLSGPAAMIRRGAAVLLRAGVAPERIRHDLVGDLAAG